MPVCQTPHFGVPVLVEAGFGVPVALADINHRIFGQIIVGHQVFEEGLQCRAAGVQAGLGNRVGRLYGFGSKRHGSPVRIGTTQICLRDKCRIDPTGYPGGRRGFQKGKVACDQVAVCLGKVTAGNQPGVVEKTLDFASKTVVCAGNIAVFFEETAGGVEVLTGFVRVDGHRIQRCTQIRIQRKLGLFVDEISGIKQRKTGKSGPGVHLGSLVCELCCTVGKPEMSNTPKYWT